MGSDYTSLEAAKNKAIADVIGQLSFLVNSTVQVSSTYERGEATDVKLDGNESIRYTENFVQIIKVDGEEITITGLKKEEEYWQKVKINGKVEYQYWLLMKIPKPNSNISEIKQGYGMQGVWRSALVPGWGQLYKREKKKGLAILGGTGLLALGTVVTYSQYNSNLRLAQQNSNIYVRTQYIDRADSWRNGSYVCIAGIAALYIYNIIDAATSKGAKKYAYLPDNRINLYAFYDNQNIFNVGFKLNF